MAPRNINSHLLVFFLSVYFLVAPSTWLPGMFLALLKPFFFSYFFSFFFVFVFVFLSLLRYPWSSEALLSTPVTSSWETTMEWSCLGAIWTRFRWMGRDTVCMICMRCGTLIPGKKYHLYSVFRGRVIPGMILYDKHDLYDFVWFACFVWFAWFVWFVWFAWFVWLVWFVWFVWFVCAVALLPRKKYHLHTITGDHSK